MTDIKDYKYCENCSSYYSLDIQGINAVCLRTGKDCSFCTRACDKFSSSSEDKTQVNQDRV